MRDPFIELNKILSNYSKGNKNIAYKKLKKFSKNHPNNQKIYFNLAIIEQDLGLLSQAIASYEKLIKNYNNLNSKINLYLLYIKEQDYKNALRIIELIENSQSSVKILIDKAYILLKINDIQKCMEICNSIILKEGENLDAINLIGCCFLEQKKYKEAENKFLLGISYNNKDIALLNSLGNLYFHIWNLKKAEIFYKKALDQNLKSYQALNNLAGFYLETDNSKKALVYYLKALEIMPNESTILNNLAKTYLSLSDFINAEKYCRKALEIKKEDSYKKILSIIYFQKLNFKRGWEYFDGRLGLNDFVKRNTNYKLIKLKLLKNKQIDPNKKLLVIREQGVGDEILYGTIYKDLLKNFNKITIEADSRLIPLFLNSFDKKYEKSFVKLGHYSNHPEKIKTFDQILYSGSLGYYFRNNLEDFPKKNYIKIPDKEINEGKVMLNICKKNYKIGLSWKSFNNLYANQKSLSLIDFNFLIQSKNLDFVNLQYGDVDKEINTYNKNSKSKIHTLPNIDLFNDFIKIAAVLKNLDLFISVSNSTAHLAGSLGVKTLLIKPFNQATFHYWNQPTNRTPWYESIELISRSELRDKEIFEKKVLSKLN